MSNELTPVPNDENCRPTEQEQRVDVQCRVADGATARNLGATASLGREYSPRDFRGTTPTGRSFSQDPRVVVLGDTTDGRPWLDF